MVEFENRTAELERLRSLYESDDAELAVIFGRRRLGKTALVKQSIFGHPPSFDQRPNAVH